jgi:hypothetical protein
MASRRGLTSHGAASGRQCNIAGMDPAHDAPLAASSAGGAPVAGCGTQGARPLVSPTRAGRPCQRAAGSAEDFGRGAGEIGPCGAPAESRVHGLPMVGRAGSCNFSRARLGPEHSAQCGSHRSGPGRCTGAGLSTLRGGRGGTCAGTGDNCGLQLTTGRGASATTTTLAWSGLVRCLPGRSNLGLSSPNETAVLPSEYSSG